RELDLDHVVGEETQAAELVGLADRFEIVARESQQVVWHARIVEDSNESRRPIHSGRRPVCLQPDASVSGQPPVSSGFAPVFEPPRSCSFAATRERTSVSDAMRSTAAIMSDSAVALTLSACCGSLAVCNSVAAFC